MEYGQELSRLGRLALKYAAYGWPVFACNAYQPGRDAEGNKSAKTPLVICYACYSTRIQYHKDGSTCRDCGVCVPASGGGFKLATTDAATVRGIWTAAPNANIGVPASAGRFVVDIDTDENGNVSPEWAALLEKHGPLPHTPMQRTGTGGQHYIFRTDNVEIAQNSASKIAPKVDTRGEGGYIIVPGSTHPNGNEYKWDPAHLPTQTPIAELPQWIADLIMSERTSSRAVVASPMDPAATEQREPPQPRPGVTQAEHAEYMRAVEYYTLKALSNEDNILRSTSSGGRNDQLNRSTFALGRFVKGGLLSERVVRERMTAAAIAIGLPHHEVEGTINSALRSPKLEAFSWLTYDQWEAENRPQRSAARMHGEQGALPAPKQPERLPVLAREPDSRRALAIVGGTDAGDESIKAGSWRGSNTGSEWGPNGQPDGLELNDDGGLKRKSLINADLYVRHHRDFQNLFVLNVLDSLVYLSRRPEWADVTNEPITQPYPRRLEQDDVLSVRLNLAGHRIDVGMSDLEMILNRVAKAHETNPVRDTLAGLVWDGKERLDTWLIDYAGAEDSNINRAFSSKWLISAVARTYRPGCKADAVLVLQGPQGARKSTTLRMMCEAVKGGYTDRVSALDSKDSEIEIQGQTIVEFAELDTFSSARASKIKAFLSAQEARYRPPYGRAMIIAPRSCVFAGTVNPTGTGWIHDHTGGRRFWPVTVSRIDLDALKDEAVQIWAEAVHRYEAGEAWWIKNEEEALFRSAETQQLEEIEGGLWDDLILDWLENAPGERRLSTQTTVDEVLKKCVKLEASLWRRNHRIDASNALRAADWERKLIAVKIDGKKTKRKHVWFAPGAYNAYLGTPNIERPRFEDDDGDTRT